MMLMLWVSGSSRCQYGRVYSASAGTKMRNVAVPDLSSLRVFEAHPGGRSRVVWPSLTVLSAVENFAVTVKAWLGTAMKASLGLGAVGAFTKTFNVVPKARLAASSNCCSL